MPPSQPTAPPGGPDTGTAAVVTLQPLATHRCNQEKTTGWLVVVQTAMAEAMLLLVQEAMGLLGTTAMEVPKLPSLVQEGMDPSVATAMGVAMLLWLIQEVMDPSAATAMGVDTELWLIQEAMDPSAATAMGVDTELWLVQEAPVTEHMPPLVLI